MAGVLSELHPTILVATDFSTWMGPMPTTLASSFLAEEQRQRGGWIKLTTGRVQVVGQEKNE